ncbi:hypothetical protein GCM10022396_03750 [Flavivirga amylovorans]
MVTLSVTSQEKEKEQPKDYSENVKTLDNTIKSLYAVISGERGAPRDWELFKFLFKPGAKLIPSGKNKDGELKVRYMSPDDYVKSSGKWLVENGFFEKEIHREVDTFGNIAQVFSTYEAFYSRDDKKPFMRGINSIQLLNDGKRWWVINIYWTQETNENRIPEYYLPKK